MTFVFCNLIHRLRNRGSTTWTGRSVGTHPSLLRVQSTHFRSASATRRAQRWKSLFARVEIPLGCSGCAVSGYAEASERGEDGVGRAGGSGSGNRPLDATATKNEARPREAFLIFMMVSHRGNYCDKQNYCQRRFGTHFPPTL